MFNGKELFYTPDDFAAHLSHIVSLIESFENYHVRLVKRSGESRYTVYAKEDTGVVVAKSSLPPAVLLIHESNITAAFWDFLKGMTDENSAGTQEGADREAAAALRRYIEKLKS